VGKVYHIDSTEIEEQSQDRQILDAQVERERIQAVNGIQNI